ncbi:MAG: hypothetical protein P8J32_08075 [bacterium]|nr:hypothetical protein [bacterium]
MIPLLAIPLVSEATDLAASNDSFISQFISQPIDAILFDLLLWFGWIPILWVVGYGFAELWLDYKRGQFVGRRKYVMLAINVPAMTEQTPRALENMFHTLYSSKSSITWKEKWIDGKLNPVYSFEIISTEGYIQFLVRTQTRYRDVIEAGIYAHYPDAEVVEVEDYVTDFPRDYPNDEYDVWGAEVTLSGDQMFPIRTYEDFEDRMTQEIKDPLGFTLEQLAKMRPGEHFWIQILVQPSNNDWAKKSLDYVKEMYGDTPKAKKSGLTAAFENTVAWPSEFLEHATGIDLSSWLTSQDGPSEDDPWKTFKISLPDKEKAEAVLKKAAKNGFGTKIRVVYVAQNNAFAKGERTTMVKGIFNQYTNLNINKFGLYVPQVPKDDYFWMRWSYAARQRNLMTAYQTRSWGRGANPVFLNTEELATLWHFPTVTMKAPLIKKQESKRGEPPVGLPVTNLENILPNYGGPPVEGDGPTSLPGVGVITAGATTAEPPRGLPIPQVDGALPDVLPHPTAPTSKETRSDAQLAQDAAAPITLPIDEEPAQPEKADPMNELVEPDLPGAQETQQEDESVPSNLPF